MFAQAIERVDGAPGAGDAVEVVDPRGRFLGRGFWSPGSAIPVRMVVRDEDEQLDALALVRRVERAKARRERLGIPAERSDAYRLVHAEGDDLPGLVVDVYRDVAVVQITTRGIKRHEEEIFGAIARVAGARSVVEVPAGRAQAKEGIEVERRVVRGPDVEHLAFRDRGFEMVIEPTSTQKTGYFLDQTENRDRVEALAGGRRVLDLYGYVGSFALAAARGGATRVESYDSSAAAVAQGASIAHANGLSETIRHVRGDVRRVLSSLSQEGARFDLVVVDPPKLAPSVKHLRRAKAAYRRLNSRVFGVVEPGGIVATCSCSGALRADEMLRLLALAARDAKRRVRLLHLGSQGMDHPVPAAFPEGRYLKCAFLEVS